VREGNKYYGISRVGVLIKVEINNVVCSLKINFPVIIEGDCRDQEITRRTEGFLSEGLSVFSFEAYTTFRSSEKFKLYAFNLRIKELSSTLSSFYVHKIFEN
jgi:hypothetical protein